MADKINRRGFLKSAGSIGAASLLGVGESFGEPNDVNSVEKDIKPVYPQVPKRVLGKTGLEVSILGLGGVDTLENQIILYKAMEWGINFIDTSPNYSNGNSELGIGRFLKRNPERRKDLIIATKASRSKTVEDIEKQLQGSLERMNTGYIDLYHGLHGLNDPSRLTDEVRDWAKSAKERGLIRHFGFSSHENMAECLKAASKLDWIDALIVHYNFRVMQDPAMQEAMEACFNANIGLIAMKTQGRKQVGELETEADKKLTSHFMERGFSEHQAKLKAVWADKRIASACSKISNTAVMVSNVAAALDKTELTKSDMDEFREYANATCNGYCAGCGNICKGAMPEADYITDVMRYLMYYNGYGEKAEARRLFGELPAEVKERIAKIDYSAAERVCPQGLAIGERMKEAFVKLG